MLFARKSLFMGGRDNLAIDEKNGSTVVIERRNTEYRLPFHD